MPRLPGPVRRALLDLDGRDHLGFVAEVPTADSPRPVGLGRLVRTGPRTAELSLVSSPMPGGDARSGR